MNEAAAGEAHPERPGRLRKRAEFLAVRNGARASSSAFQIEARPRGDTAAPRVGFTVSKKNGNAVARNRIRRRLREAVRLHAARDMRPGIDYVIVARPAALAAPFGELCAELDRVIARIGDASARPDSRRSRKPGEKGHR